MTLSILVGTVMLLLMLNCAQLATYFWDRFASPELRMSDTDRQGLIFAIGTVQSKVLNYEPFESCKSLLTEQYLYLRDRSGFFENTPYRQSYNDFINAAGIAIDDKKKYDSLDIRKDVESRLQSASKVLMKALG